MTTPAFLPFAVPDIGDEEINEVVDSLRSGWITTGPKTKRFETDFAAYLGGNVEAIAVNSATAGLHLALEALGIGPGDEVITVSHTFTATAEVIRYMGAHPRFVDIDPATYCLDPRLLEAAITPATKAIIPVHYAGRSTHMGPILEIARKHGLKVVEDAAHALPTTCGGQLIGTLGSDATVFSFYATKTLATGEGGMLVTRHPEIAKRARVMRLHGIDRDAFDRYRSSKPAWHYQVIAPGFKYNMTDMAAALGIHQLRKVETFQARRQAIAQHYHQAFADLPVILPPDAATGDRHAWHLYALCLKPEAPLGRDAFIQGMADRCIGCSVHYIPLHQHPYWRDTYQLRPEDFPHTQRLYEGEVSLPIYTRMGDGDVERVVDAVRSLLAP
ncbi:DegT/DnrJ/EryC1/StrS family aminotransferase [Azospira inquinata]|uniref:DegT/DnrJ/EryC1/StrS family aminotransferase n=1 Tax=Azospira inquinata TaxID=2785627 RepID=A0A975XTP2_9RHOO|nr:DegT/DnrJ/EryC1/StrS family aminotransferase [Azospira inquinata]QWT46751.1 DegT/DnrJ/EryC1/StrS family aminotransferase [Azospira inquinata]QWT47925.1 DegT/DnrJ/EryC1/StrS family aminotransferase [Azospira inquinata]